MISILKELLNNSGYTNEFTQAIDDDEFHIYKAKNFNEREEYFILYQQTKSTSTAKHFLEHVCQILFDELIENAKIERYFEKNCTLIVCAEESKIDIKSILEIEEDQYNFKKNVIVYTQAEIHSLHEYRMNNRIREFDNETINSIINQGDGKSFLHFKSLHREANNYYSLIMKIIQKIPFITYKSRAQDLGDLMKDFDNSLLLGMRKIYANLMDLNIDVDESELHKELLNIWGQND